MIVGALSASSNDMQTLTTLFGLTLVGEGLNKLIKSENQGWLSLIFGLLFIGVVIFAFIFFSRYLHS